MDEASRAACDIVRKGNRLMVAAAGTLYAPPMPGEKAVRMSVTATDPLAFTPSAAQAAYELSRKRFNVIPAGRRSGKTQIAKRRGVRFALSNTFWPDFRIAYTCPTYAQVKRNYWDDLHRMLNGVEKGLIVDDSKTDMMIKLYNGSMIWLIGMDRPDRFEGPSYNWVFVDEAPNTKKEAIEQHIFPALSERLGGMDMYGVPEGHNHYYKTAMFAQEERNQDEWGYHWWRSRDVMPIYLGEAAAEKEIERAQLRMDELTFKQEYEAEFIYFSGRAYYKFERAKHASQRLPYDPLAPLHLAFDFNIKPGVAVAIQEMREQRSGREKQDCTLVIGDVTIPKNSTTPAVCRAVIAKWGAHKGQVYCYGDATGGAGGSAKVRGSDWELIKQDLNPVFGSRLHFRVPRRNPPERARVNAVNSRLESAGEVVRLLVDPSTAADVATDLDEVLVLDGGSGQIDKKEDKSKTHHTDALGYYVIKRHPVDGGYVMRNQAI